MARIRTSNGRQTAWWAVGAAIATTIAAAGCGRAAPATAVDAAGDTEAFGPALAKSGTFSIVAVDPEGGVCGAAVASHYPAVGDVVPFVRSGVGAFCTQHIHNPNWGSRALDLLAADKSPADVLAELTRDDSLRWPAPTGHRRHARPHGEPQSDRLRPRGAVGGARWPGAITRAKAILWSVRK